MPLLCVGVGGTAVCPSQFHSPPLLSPPILSPLSRGFCNARLLRSLPPSSHPRAVWHISARTSLHTHNRRSVSRVPGVADFSSQGGATAAPAAACHCEAVGSARVSSPPLRCAPLCLSLPSPPTPTHPHPTHLHPTSACPVSAVLYTIMPTSRTSFGVQ